MSNSKGFTNAPAPASGLLRWWRATCYSLAGLRAAYQEEAAFRQEVWFALVLVPAALLLPLPLMARALLVAAMLLVLAMELLNSAIEAVVDLVSPGFHPLAKKAKDAGSAAVLVSLVILALGWLCALIIIFKGA